MTRIFAILLGVLALGACDYGGGYSDAPSGSYESNGY